VNAFGVSWVLAIALLVPATSFARIYKWTDESGRTVYADAPPAKASKVKHVEVVIDDDPPTRRREQELEQRIARLEREVRAAQSAPPQYPAAAPQYPTALPPPDYYASSSYGYPGSFYPLPYSYPYVVIARPAPRFFAPRFASRSFSFRQGVMHARR
jgi:hypothetical protein